MSQVRVAVNGYGVIGKRVADAVVAQPDMTLVGVADVGSDYRVQVAAERDVPVFAVDPEARARMEASGIDVSGSLSELLCEVDLVVDATPKGVGSANLARYRELGVRAVFQGGEAHTLTGHSFVAQANYASALGRDATRVVSCNTTATVRILSAFQRLGLLARARGVLIRRATDPWQAHRGGVMNTLVPEPDIPSHQGPDAGTVLEELDVVTMAVRSPHTRMHLHYWTITLTQPVDRDHVLRLLAATPRLRMVRVGDGVAALNSTAEMMLDLGRPRGDMWEAAVWEDVLAVEGAEVFLPVQVDNQAIVVPENIDAIRALTGTVAEAARSMALTDAALDPAVDRQDRS